MNKKNLLVTGGTGMVGKAVQSTYGNTGAVYLGSSDCDLTNFERTCEVLEHYKPTHIIHLAAKVGGVQGNTIHVGDFCAFNQQINSNLLRAAYELESCERVVSLLSTCVYPDEACVTYPLTEDQLHAGPPHDSNFGYAYAKRMIEVQSRAYNQQLGRSKFLCAIPNNIFGTHDNFDLEGGHVVPSMIRKIYEARESNQESVEMWGDGRPCREFTYAPDIARDLLLLTFGLKEGSKHSVYNIGNVMEEMSIADVVAKVCDCLGWHGEIRWNTDKPSGQLRKPSKTLRFMSEFPMATNTTFDDGLKETCKWFVDNYPNVRGVGK